MGALTLIDPDACSWTKLCTQVFDWLPLAAVIHSRVFVCHGGISRQLTSANSVQVSLP